jgi:peptidoglycan/LPS O-acetylase OafA/YrhL
VEGMNITGLLLGYLAVFVLGGALLVALGLLVAGLTRASKFLFASGFLLAALIAAVAALSFLDPQFNHGDDSTETFLLVLGVAVIFLLAGAGQFIAAFRGPRRYAAALACALVALAIGMAAFFGGIDVVPFKLPGAAAVSILLVLASVVIAVVPGFGGGQEPTDDIRR